MIGANKIKLLLFLSLLAAVFTTANFTSAKSESADPVLVELFTSEGCSSCPPADQVLIDLQSCGAAGADVIVLSEHVDYWDYLGWRDKYSSPLFTRRQYDYADILRQSSVYTPEAVIDGSFGVIGSNAGAVKDAIQRSSRNKKAIVIPSIVESTDGSGKQIIGITVNCPKILSGRQAQVYLAIAEDNLKTEVRAGENGGRTLPHTGVVRNMQKLPSPSILHDGNITLPKVELVLAPHWNRAKLRVVAFLQDSANKEILGVGQVHFR